MLNFCDFIQVFVFTRNHHLNLLIVFMPPLSKKLRGNIGLGLSDRLSISSFAACKTREPLELGT